MYYADISDYEDEIIATVEGDSLAEVLLLAQEAISVMHEAFKAEFYSQTPDTGTIHLHTALPSEWVIEHKMTVDGHTSGWRRFKSFPTFRAAYTAKDQLIRGSTDLSEYRIVPVLSVM